MIVQNLYHGKLNISEEGVIVIENGWMLSLSGIADAEAFLSEATEWAGRTGDPFRIPEPDGNYHFSERIRVSSIDIKQHNPALCEVTFHGEDCGTEEGEEENPIVPTGHAEDEFHTDGSHTRTCTFRAPAGVDEALIPRAGQLLEWEGGSFGCESCEIIRYKNSGLKFTVRAREVSLLELDTPVSAHDADGFETAETRFFVNCAARDVFMQEHEAGSAAEWAGDGFFLESSAETPHGKLGTVFTLKARKPETRRIGIERSEQFAGFNHSGGIRREIIWTARWRVLAAEVENFYYLTGTVPLDWAEINCIVSRVTPRRISALEYEVTVEAQHRRNPGLFRFYEDEDRSGLDDRTDVSVDMADFFITAEMAGYQKLPDGRYMPIPQWLPNYNCPIVTTTRLEENMIESTLRCLVITVSEYKKGGAADHIPLFHTWALSKVYSGSVAGNSGSYLKIRQTCREVRDEEGTLYTRLTRTYQRAPGSLEWSSYYWTDH